MQLHRNGGVKELSQVSSTPQWWHLGGGAVCLFVFTAPTPPWFILQSLVKELQCVKSVKFTECFLKDYYMWWVWIIYIHWGRNWISTKTHFRRADLIFSSCSSIVFGCNTHSLINTQHLSGTMLTTRTFHIQLEVTNELIKVTESFHGTIT